MRNPSKNTAKKIMRRAHRSKAGQEEIAQWNWNDGDNYFLFNVVGARLYTMSKGIMCNREPDPQGGKQYLMK